MDLRYGVRPGRLLAIVVALVAFTVALGGGVAFAEEEIDLDSAAVQRLFDKLQASPVTGETCDRCHGSITDTDNYASEIIFTHANHIMLQCSSCHTRFPHRPEGTSRPTMKGCWDCHGVRHGPMGELATGECNDCHLTEKERLRPSFHQWDWSGKPHVEPSNKEFNTKCAMCHEPASCVDCHEAEGIEWEPASWDYDSSGAGSMGCLACHGNSLLSKQGLTGAKSYQVTGVEDSVHQSVTCQQCHVDYRYDDKPSATPLWTVNASYACADCHASANTGDAEKDERLSAPVDAYNKSVHAAAIADGQLDSATCGSCHGGHFIYSTETDLGKQRMHLSAYRVCARCKQHGDDYDTYDDYYHGKAYKASNPDAPSCWDCHGSHDILATADASSLVNSSNVGETCGQEGCHSGSSEKFGSAAAKLIHEKTSEEAENPILKFINGLKGR